MPKKAKKPLVLTSISQVREGLQQQNSYTAHQGYLSNPQKIVDKSVEGNIFRVFGGLYQPSECFRQWGSTVYARLQSAIDSSQSQEGYDRVIQAYARHLAQAWADTYGEKLSYGPATKMVNLLIKTLFLNQQLRLKSLPQWYNVPFDSFTLIPLTNFIDELLPDHIFAIPMNQQMTMNYVLCEEQYRSLQQAIQTLCRGTGRTPLDYEIWAWNSRH